MTVLQCTHVRAARRARLSRRISSGFFPSHPCTHFRYERTPPQEGHVVAGLTPRELLLIVGTLSFRRICGSLDILWIDLPQTILGGMRNDVCLDRSPDLCGFAAHERMDRVVKPWIGTMIGYVARDQFTDRNSRRIRQRAPVLHRANSLVIRRPFDLHAVTLPPRPYVSSN